MSRRALAYLDGGPANGVTLELDQPDWAPLVLLRLEINGRQCIYERVKQPRPAPGRPWRYVPRQKKVSEYSNGLDGNYDPFDD